MEGLLARWALVIQEYDFHIVYRKGQHNNSADAQSWKAHRSLDITAASVALQAAMEDIRQSQKNDAIIQEICKAFLKSSRYP